jgi:uncharacterized delta-60 repeat protein
LINHILSDSDNSNNNNSGSSDDSNNYNSGGNNSGSNNSGSNNSGGNNSGSNNSGSNNSGGNNSGSNNSGSNNSGGNNSGSNNSGSNNSGGNNSGSNNSGSNNSGGNNSGSNNSGSNNSGGNNSGSNNSGSNNSGGNNSGSNNSGSNNSGGSGNTFTPAIGVLDTSFNSPNGYKIQPIGSSNDRGQSLAIQPNGKILLGGYCRGVSTMDFCIARFNSNGTLDTTFGSSGKIIQPIGSANDEGYSLAIQPDGKILLGGSCVNINYPNRREFCIARFNSDGISDGTLDTSFGDSGKVILGIYITQGSQTTQTHATGQSLAIQPDRKILLGGRCQIIMGFNEFCIARFNPNGTLDTTFGSPKGYIIQSLYPSEDWGYSLAIQTDGKILLGGSCVNPYNANRYEFCIARFNSDGISDGTLDTSFGTGGKVRQAFGSGSGYDWGQSLVIQPDDGKILLGGHCHNGSNFDFCIARFNPNGTLDTTFGTGGKVIQPIGSGNDHGYSLAIQPDKKILLGGHCHNGSNFDFCIARFNPNGTLDTTFGTGGKVIQLIGSTDDKGYSLVIQPDGKILLGGYCYNGSNYDFCIARFK